MFSGYINVDAENGRNIFYWFMEAQENEEDAPVVSVFVFLGGFIERVVMFVRDYGRGRHE
ncbi:unnamed protein product, partial [Ectocarpus sp. 13 AM-2016]